MLVLVIDKETEGESDLIQKLEMPSKHLIHCVSEAGEPLNLVLIRIEFAGKRNLETA